MGTMDILLIVFGFIVGLVVLFTLVTVVRDMLKENREVRRTEAERRLIADQKALIERTRLEAEQLEAEKALAKAKLPAPEAPVAIEAPVAPAAPIIIEKDDSAIKELAAGIAEIKALLEAKKEEKVIIEEPAPVIEEKVVIVEKAAPVIEEEVVEPVIEEEVAETVVEEVVEEPVIEEEVVVPVIEEKPDVAFNTTAKDTLEEKYMNLSAEQKAFYDEIALYAANKEDAKKFKNLRYEEYKIGKARLVRMLIKRSQVVCEFIMYNSDFKNYVNENKVSVKQAATVIKITDAAAVQAAKDSMDIVVNTINEEKEYKKQQAKERRKAARLAKQQAE